MKSYNVCVCVSVHVVLPLFLGIFVCGIRSVCVCVFPNRNLLQKTFCLVKYVDRCIPINTLESNYFLCELYMFAHWIPKLCERKRERELEHSRVDSTHDSKLWTQQSHIATNFRIEPQSSSLSWRKKFFTKNTRNQMNGKKIQPMRESPFSFAQTHIHTHGRYSSHIKQGNKHQKYIDVLNRYRRMNKKKFRSQ